jgi:hypothetical protein
MRGTMLYKFGGNGLKRALEKCGECPITELDVWKKTSREYERVLCLRERIITDASCVPCGCETHE